MTYKRWDRRFANVRLLVMVYTSKSMLFKCQKDPGLPRHTCKLYLYSSHKMIKITNKNKEYQLSLRKSEEVGTFTFL